MSTLSLALRCYTLKYELVHIGLSRCVFNGHIYQIALRVQVNVEIFVDLASFSTTAWLENSICAVSVSSKCMIFMV